MLKQWYVVKDREKMGEEKLVIEIPFNVPEKCGKWQLTNKLKAQLLEGNDAETTTLRSSVLPFSEDQWPSVAYLLHVRNKTSCTVSIIGSKWLLTSYKCIAEK